MRNTAMDSIGGLRFVVRKTVADRLTINKMCGAGCLHHYATATVSDPSGIFFGGEFNTVAIGYTAGELNSFTLQSAQVIYTAVSEPSTYAVIAGAFVLIGAAIFRRRATLR